MEQLSQAQVFSFRLRRQHLAQRAGSHEMLATVSNTCGLQAQVLSAAQIGLWARVADITLQDVAHAIWDAHTLIKTWAVRNTLHLIPAADLPIFVHALRDFRVSTMERWMAESGIHVNDVRALNEAILEVLAEGPLTRREIAKRINPEAGSHVERWLHSGWGGIFHMPAAQGLICFGPTRGTQPSFVRIDQWSPGMVVIAPEEAQNMLLRNYLKAYGPATINDFSRWAGRSPKDLRPIWSKLEPEMAQVEIEGQKKAWLLREDLAAAKVDPLPSPHIKLLPTFDNYLLAHQDKQETVDKAFHKQIFRVAGWISSVILIDGRVAGVWSYKWRGKKLEVTLEPFAKLSRPVRATIKDEAADLGRFLGAPEVKVI